MATAVARLVSSAAVNFPTTLAGAPASSSS